jgi:hypothetical protein
MAKARSTWSCRCLLPAGILLFGIVLRATQFLANRSLWLDEAYLASSILHRSFSGLLLPLDHNQYAPLGYLFVEKFITDILGDSEMALRLPAFLASLISLPLFYAWSRELLERRPALIALGLFAISQSQIYYASELKQYSTDVLFCLALSWAAARGLRAGLTARWLIVLGLLGTVVIWFSQPALFVLAGLGFVLTWQAAALRQTRKMMALVPLAGTWGVSVAGSYGLSMRPFLLGNYSVVAAQHDAHFWPYLPRTLSDLARLVSDTVAIFRDPGDMYLPGLACFAFVVGLVAMHHQKRQSLCLLILPVAFTAGSSLLHLYPFWSRLILFLTPTLFVLIARGIDALIGAGRIREIPIGALVSILIFVQPCIFAVQGLSKPRLVEELRSVVQYVSERRQDGDRIYVYYGAEAALRYYGPRFGIMPAQYKVGVASRDDWQQYASDLDALSGQGRVWVIFSHVAAWNGADERLLFLYHLDTIGKRLDAYGAYGAEAYLYDCGRLSP